MPHGRRMEVYSKPLFAWRRVQGIESWADSAQKGFTGCFERAGFARIGGLDHVDGGGLGIGRGRPETFGQEDFFEQQ